jgi:hypothetical protein
MSTLKWINDLQLPKVGHGTFSYVSSLTDFPYPTQPLAGKIHFGYLPFWTGTTGLHRNREGTLHLTYKQASSILFYYNILQKRLQIT